MSAIERGWQTWLCEWQAPEPVQQPVSASGCTAAECVSTAAAPADTAAEACHAAPAAADTSSQPACRACHHPGCHCTIYAFSEQPCTVAAYTMPLGIRLSTVFEQALMTC